MGIRFDYSKDPTAVRCDDHPYQSGCSCAERLRRTLEIGVAQARERGVAAFGDEAERLLDPASRTVDPMIRAAAAVAASVLT